MLKFQLEISDNIVLGRDWCCSYRVLGEQSFRHRPVLFPQGVGPAAPGLLRHVPIVNNRDCMYVTHASHWAGSYSIVAADVIEKRRRFSIEQCASLLLHSRVFLIEQ